MAKPSYRVPYSLAQSYANATISIQSKADGHGKVLPLMVVLGYILSGIVCMMLIFESPIGSMGNPVQIALFVIFWAALTVVCCKYDGTRRMNVQRITTLLAYIPSAARYVYTRRTRSALPFYNIANIKTVEDDGLILYEDKTFGYMYRVVGSASILLFESDQDAILSRVDNFFKKWQTDSEVIFITTKEGQKTYRQLSNLQTRYQGLQNDDPDLRDLAEEQFTILRDHVGREFKSIHQYMIIKSDNKEALRVANNILQNEVENSALFIKQCVPLEKDDTLEVLKSVYRKGE